MKKGLKITAIIIGLIVLVVGAGVVVWNSFIERSVETYGEFDNYHGYGNLWVFPEEISENAKNVDYYYFDMDTFMDPTCQIYLSCTYDTETFQQEKERLAELNYEIQGVTNEVMYSEDLFKYPAYISAYGWSSCYEYALIIEGEQKIVYVYLQGIPEILLSFEKEYSPYYVENADNEIKGKCIYENAGYFIRDLKWEK